MRTPTLLPLMALLASSCATVSRPYFYDVEKGGKHAVVLGTIHRGVALNELPGRVVDELRGSTAVFLELDTRSIPDPESDTYEKDLKNYEYDFYFISEGEKTLDKKMSPEYWQKFLARVRPEVKREMLKELTAYGALGVITMPDQPLQYTSQYQYDLLARPQSSMDFRLEQEARKAKITTYELDDWDHQKGPRSLCEEEHEKFYLAALQRRLDNEPLEEDRTLELMDAYRSSNDAALQSFISDRNQEEGICVLQGRNEKWAEKLDRYLSRVVFPGKKIFVAVGVAHLLPGKYPSLLELMAKQGYNITRKEK